MCYYKSTLGSEKANLFIFEKCFDEPPSTTYDASVKGAPTKPSTAALLSTCRKECKCEITQNVTGKKIQIH